MIKKIFRDLFSILYDDLNFKCLSLPRVLVAVGFLVVLVSWIAEQFFGKTCPHFTELCGFFGGGSLANFAWSKFTDRDDPLIKKIAESTNFGDGNAEGRENNREQN